MYILSYKSYIKSVAILPYSHTIYRKYCYSTKKFSIFENILLITVYHISHIQYIRSIVILPYSHIIYLIYRISKVLLFYQTLAHSKIYCGYLHTIYLIYHISEALLLYRTRIQYISYTIYQNYCYSIGNFSIFENILPVFIACTHIPYIWSEGVTRACGKVGLKVFGWIQHISVWGNTHAIPFTAYRCVHEETGKTMSQERLPRITLRWTNSIIACEGVFLENSITWRGFLKTIYIVNLLVGKWHSFPFSLSLYIWRLVDRSTHSTYVSGQKRYVDTWRNTIVTHVICIYDTYGTWQLVLK